MEKIYLVEDDTQLQNQLKDYLQRYDYEVYTVHDFKKVEDEFNVIQPDLVLLDINLPYYDGLYLCRVMRKKSNVPIIIISARTSEAEQIIGLEQGADDYITKPLNLHLLLTKIKVLLRRISQIIDNDITELCGLKLNNKNYKVSYNQKDIEFSKNEFNLLRTLIKNKDQIVTREELLEELWDENLFVEDNTLTVNVTRVKNKLKDLGIDEVIKTKRGVGYYLNSTVILGE